MLYSILKDDSPSNTIKKIKKILYDLNIELKEDFYIDDVCYAPVSVRLELKNNSNIGSNGKGTCKENALASAYAEFIERLQNLILFPESLKYINLLPDKTENEECLKKYNINLKKYFYKKLLLYKKINSINENYDQLDRLVFCPFYSVQNSEVYNLPYNIVCRIKGSNGMAAGNTYQEAMVQGLSEVCERYAVKQVFIKKIVLPDIPEECYLKYKTIKEIVNYFENNNFHIHIKDASLEGQIPVVCAIIEDKINNIFTPSFGSHPSLPVAIERALTEFSQGIILSNHRKFNNLEYPCYSKEKLKYASSEDLYKSLFRRKAAFSKTNKLKKLFFNDNFSYGFSKECWIEDNRIYSNNELLNFLTAKILNISDDIFVRDVSFLGFPSVDIFVPNMSEVMDYNKKNLTEENLDCFWSIYSDNNNKNDYNVENLLRLAETYYFTEGAHSRKIFDIPFEYIALLCSLVLKDSVKILKYLDIICGQNNLVQYYTKEQILTFKIIKDYYSLINKKKNIEYILEKLKTKYTQKDINYAVSVIEELNFSLVLDIALKKRKLKSYRNKKFIKKIENKYKKNLPNQLYLKNIFV